jgi:hypothetical protein
MYYPTKIALKLHLRATLILFISFLAVNHSHANSLTADFSDYYLQTPDSSSFAPDTLSFGADSLALPADSSAIASDTLKNKSKSPINNPIFKEAKDSLLYSIDGKKVYLWGDAKVKYESMELTAAYIEYDMESSVVFAEGRPDSTGNIVGKPVFKEGEQVFNMESMRYNFDTKKAKIYGVITEEADGFLHSHDTKLMPDKSINVKGGKYTTCDHENPHFYISISKAKLLPNDKLITGPAYLVIADVPFPLILPFGFFPSKKGRSSGIVLPEYGEEAERGFFLRGGGFYLGLSDYFDLKVTGNIYSKGSWASNFLTTYRKRYRFSGSFAFDFSQNVIGEKGYPDYMKDQSYWLRWSHSQDPKANPNSTFQARLNLGSPSHNRYNAQSVDNFLTNSISSSISYSKVWPGTPFSMSTSMNHSQNNLDSTINIGFPKVAFNMNRIYPFKRKNNIGAPAWYEKIGLSYSGNLDNSVNTRTDSLLTLSSFDKMRNGMQHRIPVSTSFNILNYITVSPSANYTENWYTKTITKRWDEEEKKVVTEDVNGFKRAYQYNASLSASTKLYGMYNFKSTSKVQAVRHVMTPNVSLSYRPDFSEAKYGFYEEVQADTTGTKFQEYSIFQGALFGSPGAGKSGVISFGLANNLEMKVLSDRDSTSDTRIIKLLESFNLNSGWNMLADSMHLSPISLTARTMLFEMFNINFSGTLDPYGLDEKGNRVKDFQYALNKQLVRLTNFRTGISFSLSGGDKRGDSDKNQGGLGRSMDGMQRGRDGMPMGGDMGNPNFGESIGTGYLDGEYVDFDVPWNIRFDYSFTYSKQRIEPVTTQTLSFSGDVSLSPKWKIGFRSGYDFKGKKLTTTSLNFFRDLHCWEMSLSVVPIGYLRSFSFKINVKSGTLRDLKLSRRQSHYDR